MKGLALVNELWKSGLTAKALGRILEALTKAPDVFDTENTSFLVLHMYALKTEIQLVRKEEKLESLAKNKIKGCLVHHVVELAALKAKVAEGVGRLKKGAK